MYKPQRTPTLTSADRLRINAEILQQINYDTPPENRSPYTQEEVYNLYTGNGGLHGLNFGDFDNRYEFSKAKRDYEEGQFFTPHEVCRFIVDTVKPHPTDEIADLTCGSGNFANWLPDLKKFYGWDIDDDAVAVAKFLYPDANIMARDITYLSTSMMFDQIFLNPPYALRFSVWDQVEQENKTEASEFFCVMKAAELLKPGGYLTLIVPETFLEDEYLNRSKLEAINESYNFLCQYRLPKNAFADVGVEAFPTKVMLFQRRAEVITAVLAYTPGVFVTPEKVFPSFLSVSFREKSKLKYLLARELSLKSKEGAAFQDKITKMLFDIKRHAKTREYYEKALALINRMKTEQKDYSMTEEEWNRIRITPKKLMTKLNKYISYQSFTEREEIKLVKTNYGLRLKPYSRKMKLALTKMDIYEDMTFNDMIVEGKYPFSDKKYKKLVERKKKAYLHQSQDIRYMTPDPETERWIREFRLYDKTLFQSPRPAVDCDKALSTVSEALPTVFSLALPATLTEASPSVLPEKAFVQAVEQPVIEYLQPRYRNTADKRDKPVQLSLFSPPALYTILPRFGELILTTIQQGDLGKAFQKHYSLLAWQQGCGKSIAGIAWLKYLYARKKVNYSFIVGPAVAIKLTWVGLMKKYGIPYIQLKTEDDIDRIKPGQFVLMPLSIIAKLERKLLNFLRTKAARAQTALVLDESDECTNYRSNRTVSALRIFKRLGYKLLTTGTPTRNNVNEIYPQLELLYNNSINLLCKCESLYFVDRETKELTDKPNTHYFMKPFPPFRGQKIFDRCFNPEKTSVFGAKKKSQDILQSDLLSELINKTIITRKFEDVVGEKKYKIITHKVQQSEPEKKLYQIIMEEFMRMMKYFKKLDDSRKESLLKIIRQILLLIKAGSIPHVMEEYNCTQEPEKAKKIIELVGSWNNEKVAIGTIFKEAVAYYARKMREAFPDREIFIIKGSVEFSQRQKIITEFQATNNGILISTQESLKSSVNIPTCNRCIIECLNWNMAKMSQYYFRFIRFDSKDPKEVHLVVYEDTIEMNILALVLAKEKMNEFIKTTENVSNEELFGEFDIDSSILDSILEKAHDEDGKSYLKWGRQKVE